MTFVGYLGRGLGRGAMSFASRWEKGRLIGKIRKINGEQGRSEDRAARGTASKQLFWGERVLIGAGAGLRLERCPIESLRP